MTKDRAKELIPIIQAWIEGKTIQSIQDSVEDEWSTLMGKDPDFGDPCLVWRIKPEPREFIAVLYLQKGLIGGLFENVEDARRYNTTADEVTFIKVIEVL